MAHAKKDMLIGAFVDFRGGSHLVSLHMEGDVVVLVDSDGIILTSVLELFMWANDGANFETAVQNVLDGRARER